MSTVPEVIIPCTRAAAAAPWETESGMSFGPWQVPAMNTPSVIVATGSSLGCRSVNQSSMLHEMPKRRADLLGVGPRLEGAQQDDHVDRDAALTADRACPRPGRSACRPRPGRRAASVTSATRPRTKCMPFLLQPVVELLVVLVQRPHVDVEGVDLGPGLLHHQVPELQGAHAAHGRAVRVVALVAAADAVDQGDRLGLVTPSRRTILPSVGPAALHMRSNSRLVKTLASRP